MPSKPPAIIAFAEPIYVPISALATLDAEGWRDWLRERITYWVLAPEPPVNGLPTVLTSQMRAAAFRPAVVSARSEDPAGDLAAEFDRLAAPTTLVARGASLLLESWQIGRDGALGAAFLITLANRLAAPGIIGGLCGLLKRTAAVDSQGLDRLFESLAEVLKDQAGDEEAVMIARLLAKRRWLTSERAAGVLPALAGLDLLRLAELIAELAPNLIGIGDPDSAFRNLRLAMEDCGDWTVGFVWPADDGATPRGRALALLRRCLLPQEVSPTGRESNIVELAKRASAGVRGHINTLLAGEDPRVHRRLPTDSPQTFT